MQQVLVIDDEKNMRHMLAAMLTGHGYRVDTAPDGDQGLRQLTERQYDFVLCDIRMPNMDGMEFLQQVRRLASPVTVIMMSAFGTLETAVAAMKEGAYDYISKPFNDDEIVLVLKKAEERERLRRENSRLKEQLEEIKGECSFGSMVARSKVMGELFLLARKVAQHVTTVLITGESGTGKELVARGIHENSPRAEGPFLAVNCGSIPENLLETEFFGYVRGAFTGADQDKAGLFETAAGGTLFLDEIGELPMGMQVKLLRVLQEQEIRRVGSGRNIHVDVRILAATARDLMIEVKEGRFREDLYYRLNVVDIHLPPLRERREDIPLLCDHFIRKLNTRPDLKLHGIAPAALNMLLNHDWPGNVRELENVIERAAILSEKQIILPENLPATLGGRSRGRRLDDFFSTYSLKKAKRLMEERLITRALEAADNNKSRAAELLEISYPSLLSKIRKYGLDRSGRSH